MAGLGDAIREFKVGVSLAFDKSGFNAAQSAIGALKGDLQSFAFAIAGAAGSLFELANISSSHSRELLLQASQIGLTTDKLQELGYAAKITANVTSDELMGSLEGITKTMYESRNITSDAARTMEKLHVSVDTLRSGKVSDILEAVATEFQHMPDGIYKTALANEAFGSSGAKMIPFLNKGKEGIQSLGLEAHKMGVVLNEGFLKQGDEYDKRLSKMWFVIKSITYVIGGQLIKYMEPLVKSFQAFMIHNKQLIAMGLAAGFKGIGEALKVAGYVGKILLDVLQDIGPKLGGMQESGKAVAIAFGIWLASVAPLSVALMGVIIAAKDIYNYFHGGRSYFGDFIKQANELYIFQKIGEWMSDTVNATAAFAAGLEAAANSSTKLIAAWGFVKKIQADAVDGFGQMLDWAISGPAKDSLAVANKSLAPDRVSGPSASKIMDSLTGGAAPASQTFATNMNVYLPPGVTPEHGAAMVKNGFQKGVQEMITRNQHKGGTK